MPGFEDYDDYSRFQKSVKQKARYRHEEFVNKFLATVLDTSSTRTRVFKEGDILFRAQLGATTRAETQHDEIFEVEAAYDASRMVPQAEYALDGRVNPRGIPCLYLATEMETAMSEVRPWIGSMLSVAEFKMMRECRLVDCSRSAGTSGLIIMLQTQGDAATPEECETAVWGDISYAFSTPVSSNEPHINYVPTQILAEAFKGFGYDGIVYKSLLGRAGKSVALFDISAAELINCGLYKTKSVSFKFVQADNPYYVIKHYPELQKQAGHAEDDEAS